MSEMNWIIWQRACDAMQAEMLKELRDHLKNNVVTSHKDIDALLCEVHNPKQPCMLTGCS